jgi:arginyl-tRNA synthetase
MEKLPFKRFGKRSLRRHDRLHVHFEEDKGESFYEDKMDALLEEGKALKVFTEGEEGSYIVRFEESTGLPPYLVQKKDGGTLYSTRDIAQMRYRINAYHPQEILIVTDIAQKLYFEQLIETCKKLQMDLPSFENVLVGRMRYRDKGMSTRMGTSLKLEEVLSEAVKRADALIEEHRNDIQSDDHRVLSEMMGVGAVAYGILSQNRKSDVVFDWDKMLSLEGNSAPYLQYTHARARSVLRKGEIPHDFKMEMEVSSLTDLERLLVIALRKFSDVLEAARRELLPHKLAHYLYTLCQTFNSFYNADSILKAKEPHRSLRLYLTLLTADVLETGAALLTIRVPDRM